MKTNFSKNVKKAAKRAALFWISLLSLLGPALELAVNIECNFFAVVDRLLPGVFPYRMPFEIFSFWRRVLRALISNNK